MSVRYVAFPKLSECPAPGYRGYTRGELGNVSSSGYAWSSSVSNINGMHLNFGVTWLIPSIANCRAYGFQLRCLSE